MTPTAPVTSAAARAPRVLLACGGTGGHVYPAIAIADAVRALAPGADVAFAGTRDRMEWTAVPKAGYPIHAVTVSGFQRGLSGEALRRNLTFPLKLARGLAESWRLVGAFDPDVVVGTGGYASGPVGLAAVARRRPLVIQEQNATAGATNRLLAPRAARVFVAFEAARGAFPGVETTVAGNPVRADLTPGGDAATARAHFGLAPDAPVLLVMGGSLGAAPLNDAVEAHLDALLASGASVLWATGTRYHDAVSARVGARPGLALVPYLDRMDLAYTAASLAVCRSGALTCSELAATGTPSALVPSPNVTADHQTSNARAMDGAAILVPERELGQRMPEIAALLHDAAELDAMHRAALVLARPDAARTIAHAVLALAAR